MKSMAACLALAGSPLVGAIAGAVAVSLWLPGPMAFIGVAYAMFGAAFAYGAAIIVCLPVVLVLRRKGLPLLPVLLPLAVGTSLVIVVAFQCALGAKQCHVPAIHLSLFALVTAVTTTILMVRIINEYDAG